jgi:fructose-bisphosphate aldolase class I
MSLATLEATAWALVAVGKGILAADESHATIGRRFAEYGIFNSEEQRTADLERSAV